MPARKSSSLPALLALVLVVVGLVVWLLVGVDRGSGGGDGAASHALAPGGAEIEATAKPGSTVLAEVPRDERPAAQREVAPIEKARTDLDVPAAGELADAWWVEGRVAFPEGTPIDERVVVVAQGREFAGKKLHKSPVASDGSFRVAFSKESKKAWLRLESRYVFLDEASAVDAKAQPRDVVLKPRLGGGLRVRLVPSAAAAPFSKDLVGTTVTIQGWKEGSNGPPRMVNAKVDERLECELGGLDPEVHWSLSTAPKTFSASHLGEVSTSVGKLVPIDLPVERGVRVTGVVRDAKGAPVEGARIRVDESFTGLRVTNPFEKVTTDKEGRFVLEGVAPTTTRIGAVKSGFASHVVTGLALTDGATRDGVEFSLDREPSIRGVVRWGDGKPAADVRVAAESTAEGRYDRWWLREEDLTTKTGKDGTFALSGLRAETYRVTATASAKAAEAVEVPSSTSGKTASRVKLQVELEDVTPPSSDLVLVLAPGSSLSGRVVDDTGAPVTAFTIEVGPVRQDSDWVRSDTMTKRAFRADDGRFEVAGLSDGLWSVKATTKAGQESTASRIEIPGGADSALELVIPRMCTVRGVVLDPEGVPVVGAVVDVDPVGSQAFYFRWDPARDKSRKTDEKGNFSFAANPGAWNLSAKATGWAPSARVEASGTPAAEVGPFTLQLRRGGTITGLVLNKDNQPSASRQVSAYGSGDSENATTDATGRFRLEHLAPGEWHVSIEPTQAEIQAARGKDGEIDWAVVQPLRGQKKVTVADGGTVEITLGGTPDDPVKMFGFVRGDAPIEGAQITIGRTQSTDAGADTDNEWRTARTNAEGRYETALPGTGTYSIQMRVPGGGWTSQNKEITAAGAYQVDFQLPTGSIAGHVVAPDGKPVSGANVQVQLADPAERQKESKGDDGLKITSGFVRTDADGAFRVSSLSAGVYDVSASPAGMGRGSRGKSASHAPGRIEDVKVAESAHVDGLVVRLQEGGSLRVSVVGADGTPRPGVQVNLSTGGQGPDSNYGQTTDKFGRVTFQNLAPGPVTAYANDQDEASPRTTGAEVRRGETTELTLRMERGGSVRVFLFDSEGRPVREWFRVLDDKGLDWGHVIEWPDSADEPMLVQPLPPGRYEFSLPGPKGVDVAHESITVTAGGTGEVRLRRPAATNPGATPR